MESTQPEIVLPGGEPAAPRVLFSELIDGWLREGERLHETTPVGDATEVAAGLTLDGWRARTVDLWRTILERHRLEALVALGLLPLMLFLLLQGHAAGHSQPPAAHAVVSAPDLPTISRGGQRTSRAR